MSVLLIVIVIVLALTIRPFGAGSMSMAPTLTERENFIVLKVYVAPRRGDIFGGLRRSLASGTIRSLQGRVKGERTSR